MIVSGNPCWPFVLIDSDCGIGEFCYPIYSGGNASGCPSGNPGFLQCLNTPCQTVTTIAPTTTTSTSTTLTTPSPNCSALMCYWRWVVATNGQGVYSLDSALTSDSCVFGSGSGCGCNASPPIAYAGDIWSSPCDSVWATTTTTSTTTTTPPTSTTATTQMGCLGQCGWTWQGAENQGGNEWYGSWVLVVNNCQGDVECGCCAPVEGGGDVPISQPSYIKSQVRPGSSMWTPCQTASCESGGTTSAPTTSTTTTVPPVTEPPVTTTVTTSTTTTTTTTTTASPDGTCGGRCEFAWQQSSCEGYCSYLWDPGLKRWVQRELSRCLAVGGATCMCDPYTPVAIDPYDGTAGGSRSVDSEGTPDNPFYSVPCVCSDDATTNACSAQYVLVSGGCEGTDSWCRCPNPPTTKGKNSIVLDCVSWAAVYAATTTTTTTTADICGSAVDAPCACGCCEFVWNGASYDEGTTACTGACACPTAPVTYEGDVVWYCCL